MENIYQQAVLDAKAVRASAMANAKATIQEAFEPKIKAMLKKHIVESEEDLDEEYGSKHEMAYDEAKEMEEAEYMDTSKMNVADDGSSMDDMPMEEEMLDETALDEILAELEAMTEMEDEEEMENDLEDMEMEEMYDMDETLNEAEEEEEVEEEESEDEESEEEEESEEMEDEESNEETKVVDITLGDLVDAIKAAMGNQSEMSDMEASEDDSISLDEILAELDQEEKMEEADDYMEEKKKDDHSMEEAKKELEKAKKAIEEMRAELNEVNLLNAKLLYVNKIFKSKSLTESQKVKVLNAFDRATNVKEVKNVYATINESVTAAPKTQIKESYGFASKPTGYSQKTNTVESDPFIARMQKLAGL